MDYRNLTEVYPMKGHGFILPCFVMFYQLFVYSCEEFTYISQGGFTGWIQCQSSNHRDQKLEIQEVISLSSNFAI